MPTAAPARKQSATTRAQRNARALQRARTAPVAPRRRSGPAPRKAPAPATTVRPIARIAHGGATALLDRLLRGRGWVALVGALLAGIVFLNVSVLELNRGIATTDAKSATLERTNSTLRARVAKLDSAERIQRLAQARGFILPQPGDITYLDPHPVADARLAASRIQPPHPATAVQAPPPAAQVAAPVQQQAPVQQAPVAAQAAATPPSAAVAAAP